MSLVPAALDASNCDSAIRAEFLHFRDDPEASGDGVEHLEDGLLILRQGRVQMLVDAAEWIDFLPDGCEFYDYRSRLVLPGFPVTKTRSPSCGPSLQRK